MVPAGRVMKYLQSKTKHFLFEAGSLHRRLPERRTSSARLSLTPTGTDDGAECHPSSSLRDVTKTTRRVSASFREDYVAGIHVCPGLAVEQCTSMIHREPKALSKHDSPFQGYDCDIDLMRSCFLFVFATYLDANLLRCTAACAVARQFMWLIMFHFIGKKKSALET